MIHVENAGADIAEQKQLTQVMYFVIPPPPTNMLPRGWVGWVGGEDGEGRREVGRCVHFSVFSEIQIKPSHACLSSFVHYMF